MSFISSLLVEYTSSAVFRVGEFLFPSPRIQRDVLFIAGGESSLPRLKEHSASISVARMLMLIKTRNSNPTSPKLAEDWEQIKLTSVMIHV